MQECNKAIEGCRSDLLLGSLLLGFDVGIIFCLSPGHGHLFVMQSLRLLNLEATE